MSGVRGRGSVVHSAQLLLVTERVPYTDMYALMIKLIDGMSSALASPRLTRPRLYQPVPRRTMPPRRT